MNDRSFKKKVKSVSDNPAGTKTKRDKAVAQRKSMILEAAMICFIESGYHQTGVRDIARRAGVSLGNLYNHFAGKHDVLVAIAALERADLQPFLAILERAGRATEVLDGFVAAYAAYLAEEATVILTIEISSEAIRKPDIGALFVANRAELATAVSAVVARGIADGDVRAELDPDDVAQLILDLIDASAYRSVLGPVQSGNTLAGLKDFISSALRAR